MNRNNPIGKKAIISCTTEQLQSINVELQPGTEVTILRYDGQSPTYGPCYEVTDGAFENFGFIVPLQWLNNKG